MIPEDVIKQLVGDGESFDFVDSLAVAVVRPSKFIDEKIFTCACVDFEKGIVSLSNDKGTIGKSFAIKAELVEITDKEQFMNKEYMGDSVYAEQEDTTEMVCITTENGMQADNTIYVDEAVALNLCRYLVRTFNFKL